MTDFAPLYTLSVQNLEFVFYDAYCCENIIASIMWSFFRFRIGRVSLNTAWSAVTGDAQDHHEL